MIELLFNIKKKIISLPIILIDSILILLQVLRIY